MIPNYIYHKRPYQHLNKITNPALPPILGERIDISQNPGHKKLSYMMYLMASQEIWFGPTSLEYFDKKALLSFPDALEIHEMKEDLIFVKLFDWETPDYETENILALQKEFREWTNMNAIEFHLDKLLAE